MGFVVTLVLLPLGIGALLTIVTELVRRAIVQRRNAYNRLFDFSRARKLIYVIPTLPPDPADPAHQVVVSGEDMLAMHEVEDALSHAGWAGDNVSVELADETQVPNNENMVLVCSVKRNRVTEAVLAHLQHKVGWRFDHIVGSSSRWRLTRTLNASNPVPWDSPSYEQELKLQNPWRGPLDDYALLAKLNNPWNPDAKIILVAGIRGFGTQGAAEFLRKNVQELDRRSNGREFAMIVSVTKRDFRIVGAVDANEFRLLA